MALDKTRLITTLVNNFLDLPMRNPSVIDPNDPEYWTTIRALMPAGSDAVTNYYSLLVNALIDEIVNHAVVSVAMTNHVHSGVTSGAGTSGPPVLTGNIETGDID